MSGLLLCVKRCVIHVRNFIICLPAGGLSGDTRSQSAAASALGQALCMTDRQTEGEGLSMCLTVSLDCGGGGDCNCVFLASNCVCCLGISLNHRPRSPPRCHLY